MNEKSRKEPLIDKAAKNAGISQKNLNLPLELTLWIDPEEVCCRFGEHRGSYYTIASFKNNDKENVQEFDIPELEVHMKSNKPPSKVSNYLLYIFLS